ncbi:Interferon regulatory factor 2 [Trichoplax sp. H2]|nr:Interferon regulatory factor 2 [Trichoplax sp. H2]|eukprot:RDD44680.1 Interferon regulatory factor 2 [Trichoplax sp. H2]
MRKRVMTDWLKEILEENAVEGIHYVNGSKDTFAIKWVHASNKSYDPDCHGAIFKRWMKKSRKLDKYKSNYSMWKTNFRCAINSLPDVMCLSATDSQFADDDKYKGYKIFQFVDEKLKSQLITKSRNRQNQNRKFKSERKACHLDKSGRCSMGDLDSNASSPHESLSPVQTPPQSSELLASSFGYSVCSNDDRHYSGDSHFSRDEEYWTDISAVLSLNEKGDKIKNDYNLNETALSEINQWDENLRDDVYFGGWMYSARTFPM